MAPENQSGLDEDGRLIDEALAKEIAIRVANKTGKITDFKSQKKKKTARLPFNLSALQSECSAKLKLSAARTLEIAQELYNSDKVVSYPRSDSRYLPTGILKDEAPTILQNLTQLVVTSERQQQMLIFPLNRRHGTIRKSVTTTQLFQLRVSAEKVEKLTGDKRKVFRYYCKTIRLARQFYLTRYLSISISFCRRRHL